MTETLWYINLFYAWKSNVIEIAISSRYNKKFDINEFILMWTMRNGQDAAKVMSKYTTRKFSALKKLKTISEN